jgi:hypothetical protein
MIDPRSVRPRSFALFVALFALVDTGCSSASSPPGTDDTGSPGSGGDSGGSSGSGGSGGSGGTSGIDAAGGAASDAESGCATAIIGVDASAAELSACFPDHDGINGGTYTIDITVDDTQFSKTVIGTQNDATAILTVKNAGTKPHGFEVECTSVAPAYSTVPAGCPSVACFPANSIIAPLQPGESKTITFDTPTPDGLNYPVRSSEPGDCAVPGLNGGETQWALM